MHIRLDLRLEFFKARLKVRPLMGNFKAELKVRVFQDLVLSWDSQRLVKVTYALRYVVIPKPGMYK